MAATTDKRHGEHAARSSAVGESSESRVATPSASIIIPTYNERANVPSLLRRIRACVPDAEVVIVDDSSPDGTAEEVARLGVSDPALRLLVRPSKLGLGSAVLAGIEEARGKHIVMMDADLSHRPEDLPRMLAALDRAEIVIGSRYIPGGKITGWPIWRRIVSRSAAVFATTLLRLPAKDPTSGFAAFDRELLLSRREELQARGFKLLIELLAVHRTARVLEVPITFTNRVAGSSKFSFGETVSFFRLCLRLRFARSRKTTYARDP